MSTLRMTDAQPLAGVAARRAPAVAAAVYVVAWLTGLATTPTAPDPDASDATIHAFYAANGGATLLQATLVHCIAGLALAAFVVTAGRRLAAVDPAAREGRVFVAAGLAAAAVSLLQFVLEVALNRHAATSDEVSTSASLFHAVNVADTVKLVLLAVAIAAATRLAGRAAAFPRWLRALGWAAVPALVLGAGAFLVVSGVLSAILALSLLLLLAWVGGVAVVLTRPRAAPAPTGARA
jgi:hypothetical protein